MLILRRMYLNVSRLSSAVVLLLLVPLLFALSLAAQAVHPITGRRIAPVMGMSGADWLDREERGKEEQPEKALAALHLRPGMLVGDVGAGTGFYSLRMAQMVGPNGKVFSNDIQAPMLERLQKNAAAHNIHNIETALGTESNPNLPVNT